MKPFDIVVFGATGFTGGLVCEYLAGQQDDLRWAIAGRNKGRLEAIADGLPEARRPAVMEANISDPESMRAMTGQARVLLTTVGPYMKYGEPAIAACVATGTDYVDITGEPEFVDRMMVKYHQAAVTAGVRLISCCGFDSIPPDLGAFFTVLQLGDAESKRVEGFVRANGAYSGGTWHSAVEAMANHKGMREARRLRRPLLPAIAADRTVRSIKTGIHRRRELGAWACPLPTIDPDIVKRSARAREEYGQEFAYGHYVQVKSFGRMLGGILGVSAIAGLAQIPWTRRMLLKHRRPGQGPSEEERSRGWFTLTFLGQAGERRVKTQVRGGEPGYTETAKMVSESALALAFGGDRLPSTSGLVTPAAAMGEVLVERLQRAGISFEVIEDNA